MEVGPEPRGKSSIGLASIVTIFANCIPETIREIEQVVDSLYGDTLLVLMCKKTNVFLLSIEMQSSNRLSVVII